MRADIYLFTLGHTGSRQKAGELIREGRVRIDGAEIPKPSSDVDAASPHSVEILGERDYVSRGGIKLERALEHFSIDVTGMRAVDIGASTGGFTDCLLRRGAAFVSAVDAGSGQLTPALRSDSRVASIEGFNARRLAEGDAGGIPKGNDIAVMDVSFISQTYIIPGIPALLRAGGYFVGLIKPQFEAGREALGGGGIVRDKKYHAAALSRVCGCAGKHGFGCLGVIPSPIRGGDGNVEYLAAFALGDVTPTPSESEIRHLVGQDNQKKQTGRDYERN